MNCHRLPSLPGLSFDERLKKNHHVSHSFYYQNGYRMDRTPTVGIGKEPIQETFKDFYSEPIEYVICFKCVIFFSVWYWDRLSLLSGCWSCYTFKGDLYVLETLMLLFGFEYYFLVSNSDGCHSCIHDVEISSNF